MADNAGQPGWLTGIGAEAAACDATIVPVVTGIVDWQVVDEMTQVWIDAHGLDRGREPCGCTCGGCTCAPPSPLDAEARARLRRTLLAMAADAISSGISTVTLLLIRMTQLCPTPRTVSSTTHHSAGKMRRKRLRK